MRRAAARGTRRTAALALLLPALAVAGCAPLVTSNPNPEEWPSTCVEAVDRLVEEVPGPVQDEIRAIRQEDVVGLTHFGLGLDIRNEFGLWAGNTALAADCTKGKNIEAQWRFQPDSVSPIIVEQFWQRLQPDSGPAAAPDAVLG